MLQQNEPEDFVIATGEAHSVKEFVEESFKIIGRNIVWEGEGIDEVGKEKETGIVRVKVNPKYYRPTEVVSDCDCNLHALIDYHHLVCNFSLLC